MPDFSNESLDEVKQRLLEGMVEFMEPDEEDDEEEEDYDCGYTQRDIDRCEKFIDRYLEALRTNPSESEIRKQVQKVVLALNSLNDHCDGCLIETDQREDLCHIILVAAKHAGLETDEDITEEWREW